jgi:hypothetical protein
VAVVRENIHTYRLPVKQSERKASVKRPTQIWEGYIKTDLQLRTGFIWLAYGQVTCLWEQGDALSSKKNVGNS